MGYAGSRKRFFMFSRGLVFHLRKIIPSATCLSVLILALGVSQRLAAWDETLPPVFIIVFEEKAVDNSDGKSAVSKVEVQLAPGAEWFGYFGFNSRGGDARTPAKLYRLRGSLFGLKPGERMCFGVLAHKGSASAGGTTITSVPPDQMDAWGMNEDAARFERTNDGGILSISPFVYMGEEPPEFGMLSPGAYEYGPDGNDSYRNMMIFKLTNDELKNLQRVQKTSRATVTDGIAAVAQTYKITVAGALPEEEIEVSVNVDAYDKWLPQGNLEKAGEAGNKLQIQFQACQSSDPSLKRNVTLDVTLQDVSKEKGVCMNWPERGSQNAGLRILKTIDGKEVNEGWEVVGQDHARTTEPVESITLTVSSHDFGAYGKLHVVARDETGAEVKVKINNEEKRDLLIPRDDNHNHIADAWELAYAGDLTGSASDDNDDKPEGKPGTNGDGLTLYEEYRGFRITGGSDTAATAATEKVTDSHVRTNPKIKDLFVCDLTTGKIAGPGINYFEKIAELHLHRLAAQEISDNREVNFNRGSWTATNQHGLMFLDGPRGSDPEAISYESDAPFGPPILTRKISVPVGGSFSSGDDLATIAHEIGHAVGIAHHGETPPDFSAEWWWQLEADGTWQLYEQAIVGSGSGAWVADPAAPARPIQAYYEPASKGGSPRQFQPGDGGPEGAKNLGGRNTSRSDRWRLWVGAEHGSYSGDQQCIMRYPDKQAYVSKNAPTVVRYLPDKGQWKMRDRLCDSNKGKGVNDQNHTPQSRYGTAAVGDCKHQIVINDKYAE